MNIFVGIDLQNDFIDERVLGTKEAKIAVDNIANNILIFNSDYYYSSYIFTLDKHLNSVDYLKSPEGINLPVPHCIIGTKGSELHSKIKENIINNPEIYTKSLFIDKDTFFTPKLAESIRRLYHTKLLNSTNEELYIQIMGLCTDICVISNALALRGFFPKAFILVRQDYCAGTTVYNHKAALAIMKSNAINII